MPLLRYHGSFHSRLLVIGVLCFLLSGVVSAAGEVDISAEGEEPEAVASPEDGAGVEAGDDDFTVTTSGAIIDLEDAEQEIELVKAARADQSLSDNAPLTSPEEVLSYANEVVMNISRARFSEAWRRMRTNSAIPGSQLDAFIRSYDSHYVRTIQHFGPSVGVELISQQMTGSSMMKISYLVKYEVTGVAWFMYFYRLDNQWLLTEFNYDLNSDALFAVAGAAGGDKTNMLMRLWQSEMERRMAAIEERAAQAAAANAAQLGALEDVDLDAESGAVLLALQARIADLETRVASQGERLGAVEQAGSASGRSVEVTDSVTAEIEQLKKFIRILMKQHPYSEFPSGP